jgi:two-component system phosphate regulon sensor histidine kinase PhoR
MAFRKPWGTTPSVVIVRVPLNVSTDTAASQLKADPSTIVLPIPTEGAGELVTDADGQVRQAVALTAKEKDSTANLAFAARKHDSKYLKNPASPHLINFAGPAGTIPACTLGSVGTKDCPSLSDKIALLAAEPDSSILVRTPVGEMTRAEVIANDVHTLADRKPIYQASWVERGLLTLAMILVGAFYIIYYPVLISALAVTGTGIAVVIVLFQIIFQLFDIYVPSANIGGSLLVTYLIFTGYRLAFQENMQWRNLKQAQYLRELDQMKTNFLSLVSHDLKTPLAKIQAVTERLKREVVVMSPEQAGDLRDEPTRRAEWKELLESIENSNNELKHYITSILNLSKLESQKVILNKKSNDINGLIQQALKRLRSLAVQKQITIEEQLEPLFSVECDEDLMRQVLTNLIDNAIKYSPQGSKVIVRSREDEGFIRVEVQDFGPGIPKDQLPMMFRKFSRFLRPIKEQVKGTGLGLYLSKYFIELHGGTIKVNSVEGHGTTFTFTLPLHGGESESILG